jgi:hypothetical protein
MPAATQGVEFCFGCWPGGPVIPPPCLRCGARIGYYTSGICRRCHHDADPGVDSWFDCYAWGATRVHGWLCRGCNGWRRNHPTVDPCAVCGRIVHVGWWGRSVCRLCFKQASLLREPDGRLDLLGANRYGQQLFLAISRSPVLRSGRRLTPKEALRPLQAAPARVRHQQLAPFTMRRDMAAHGRAGLHQRADPTRAAELERHARDLGTRRGWKPDQIERACDGIRILLGIQDNLYAPIPTGDVALLLDIDMPVWSVTAVLSDAGLLAEDRAPALDLRFDRLTEGLPEPMIAELRTWFEVMKHGSATAPRRRPRSETTIGLHLRWALPTLNAWATAGRTTLRQITRDDVLDALPPSGNPRSTTGQGLKSIFRLLKARKVLFTDPTLRVKTGSHESRQPLPVDLDALRAALNSADPAQAAVVALIAFHGLRVGQLQRLHLTDVRDGRAYIDGRTIVLAEPVRDRLRAYLDHRARRWPDTANPHLFVHYRTAGRLEPVGHRWVYLAVGPDLSPAAIREDRILDETHASGGDVRRLADLFGMSIHATGPYSATLDHPDLVGDQH